MTTLTALPTRTETGVVVELRAFPACRVFVRDAEIDEAMRAGRHTFSRERTAQNIAIGIRAGTFPISREERRSRIRTALPWA